MKLVEPSLLAFDKSQLDAQLQEMQQLGVQYIHYDVMDGIFVSNTAYGPQELINVQKAGMQANVHMMVEDPIKWIEDFKNYPLHSLTFHPEACSTPITAKALALVHQYGFKNGLAIKPNTDVNLYKDILTSCDYVCIMGVEPGRGGQSFMVEAIDNLKKVKQIKDLLNPNLVIQLDGGVNLDVIKLTSTYVDHFIIGSFLMKQEDKRHVFDVVRELK